VHIGVIGLTILLKLFLKIYEYFEFSSCEPEECTFFVMHEVGVRVGYQLPLFHSHMNNFTKLNFILTQQWGNTQ